MTESQNYIRDGAEIYRNSFAIIRAEADLSRFEELEEKLVVRIIHACGMTDIAGDIRQQPHDAELARPDAEATDGQRELRQVHLTDRSRRGLARRGPGWFERNGRHEEISSTTEGGNRGRARIREGRNGHIALQYDPSHLQD